jgi:radical SAM protein with 4Fe4S-binding SPASM domain
MPTDPPDVPPATFPCRAPWDGAVIHFSGAVYPCDHMSQGPDTEAMLLGNLSESTLKEILEGEAARSLRQRLLRGDLEGLLCANCDKAGSCNLYGDPSQGKEGGLLHGGAIRYGTLPGEEPLALARLELGITDLCNMRCVMCALSRGEASPPGVPRQGLMDVELAERAISEAAGLAAHGQPPIILLHWVGEPLIHPGIQRLLKAVDVSGMQLHLVTNGISLDGPIVAALLAMSGQHTINFSLNALSSEVFGLVNASPKRDQVYRNIDSFLEARLQSNALHRWNVIVSAVVLEENLAEIPDFVEHWTRRLGASGSPASLSLNGKGENGIHQVMLLSEVDRPRSPSLFRQALRQVGHEDPAWPLDHWEHIDRWRTGEGSAQDAFASLEGLDAESSGAIALALLQEEGWGDVELARLFALAHPRSHAWKQSLRRMAFEENRRLGAPADQALLQAVQTPSEALLALKLAPHRADDLMGRIFVEGWSHTQNICDLAAILSWHSELAEKIPRPLPTLEDTGDASEAILRLAMDMPVDISQPPSAWQVRALAGLISQRENPGMLGMVHCELPDTEDLCTSILYALEAGRLPSTLRKAMKKDWDVPPWQHRALRRRWLFGGSGMESPVSLQDLAMDDGWEELLLSFSLSGSGALPFAQEVIERLRLEGPPAPHGWQDVAEILAWRPDVCSALRGAEGVLDGLRWLLRCPLLPASPDMALGVGELHRLLGLPLDGQESRALERHCTGAMLAGWRRTQLMEQLSTLDAGS